MRLEEIIEKLEELSPSSFAAGWDNVGLLAGRCDKEIKRIVIALDPSDDVIEQAVAMEADMLLTHHPMIFKPIQKINSGHFIGRKLIKLIQNDISYFVMHTNFDVMGMADAAADELGLRSREVLETTYEDEISKEGFGRIGILSRQMSLEECALFVKERFDTGAVKVFGNLLLPVKRVAISPGSGKSMIKNAIAAKAEVLITGDIDHHDGMDAVAQGLAIIDAGHFGLEHIFVPYMQEYLQRECREAEVIAARENCPFIIL